MEMIYKILLIAEFSVSIPVFILLFFISAPYGKFVKSGWGPSLNARAGWMIMEFPAVALPIFYFLISGNRGNASLTVLLLIWELHYVQRTFVYPLLLNRNSRKMPVLIVFFAFCFNLMNGTVNGYGIYSHSASAAELLHSFRLIPGLILFLAGFLINLHSDSILRNLRKPGETEYKIPRKGLFRLVCSPHYFGEILEWTGWVILTWSVAGAAFLVFTIANLVPRAVSHLKWYRSHFPEFPPERKAVFPFLL